MGRISFAKNSYIIPQLCLMSMSIKVGMDFAF